MKSEARIQLELVSAMATAMVKARQIASFEARRAPNMYQQAYWNGRKDMVSELWTALTTGYPAGPVLERIDD